MRTQLVRLLDAGDLAGAKKVLSTATSLPQGSDALRRTLLHKAVILDDSWFVHRLLELGADPNVPDYRKNTPLHLAAGVARAQSIERMLASKADRGARNAFQASPLHEAAAGTVGDPNVRVQCMRLLLMPELLNSRDASGRTALWYATSKGTAAVVSFLLDAGADPDARADGRQGSPREVALQDPKLAGLFEPA